MIFDRAYFEKMGFGFLGFTSWDQIGSLTISQFVHALQGRIELEQERVRSQAVLINVQTAQVLNGLGAKINIKKVIKEILGDAVALPTLSEDEKKARIDHMIKMGFSEDMIKNEIARINGS